MSYVYFLVEPEHHRFKIGKSRSPAQRARELSAHTFDLAASWQIECDDERVRKLESCLHLYCHRYSIQREEITGVGRTEWFRIEALREALAFATKHHAQFGCEVPEPVFDTLAPTDRDARRKRTPPGLWTREHSAGMLLTIRQLLNYLRPLMRESVRCEWVPVLKTDSFCLQGKLPRPSGHYRHSLLHFGGTSLRIDTPYGRLDLLESVFSIPSSRMYQVSVVSPERVLDAIRGETDGGLFNEHLNTCLGRTLHRYAQFVTPENFWSTGSLRLCCSRWCQTALRAMSRDRDRILSGVTNCA